MSNGLNRFSHLVCKSIDTEIEALFKEMKTEDGKGLMALPRVGAIRALKTVRASIIKAVKQIEKEQESNQ